MPETKLKPCPFCGSRAKAMVRISNDQIEVGVGCHSCRFAISYAEKYYTFKCISAVMDCVSNHWNRRVGEEEVKT